MKHFMLSAAIVVGLASAASASTISTLGQDTGPSPTPWGLPNTAFYGQTFTTVAGSSLDNVLFRFNDFGSSINYDLHVYSWTGATGSGGNLASVSGSTAGIDGVADESIATGGIALSAGQYVVGFQATSSGSSRWNSSGDAIAGEGFVFQNNGGDATQLIGGFFSNFSGTDLAFELKFDSAVPVPLPAGLPLLAFGLGAIALVSRRRHS